MELLIGVVGFLFAGCVGLLGIVTRQTWNNRRHNNPGGLNHFTAVAQKNQDILVGLQGQVSELHQALHRLDTNVALIAAGITDIKTALRRPDA